MNRNVTSTFTFRDFHPIYYTTHVGCIKKDTLQQIGKRLETLIYMILMFWNCEALRAS